MDELKIKKTFSFILAISCFVATLSLGIVANLFGTVNQLIAFSSSYSGASLLNSQSHKDIYNVVSASLPKNGYVGLLWIIAIIIITPIGFYCGHLIDVRWSKYKQSLLDIFFKK